MTVIKKKTIGTRALLFIVVQLPFSVRQSWFFLFILLFPQFFNIHCGPYSTSVLKQFHTFRNFIDSSDFLQL